MLRVSLCKHCGLSRESGKGCRPYARVRSIKWYSENKDRASLLKKIRYQAEKLTRQPIIKVAPKPRDRKAGRLKCAEAIKAYSRSYYEKNREAILVRREEKRRSNGILPKNKSGQVPCSKCGILRVVKKRCIECSKASRSLYLLSKKEEIARKRSLYNKKNALSRGDYAKSYRAANLERLKSLEKQRKDQSREKINQKSREAWKAMTEERRNQIRDNAKKYYEENADRIRGASKLWAKSNPDQVKVQRHIRRARESNALGQYSASEWQAILVKYKNNCVDCGVSGKQRKMTVDHIVPLSRGGTNFAFNLQPLCRSCNARKHARLSPSVQHSLFDRLAA